MNQNVLLMKTISFHVVSYYLQRR